MARHPQFIGIDRRPAAVATASPVGAGSAAAVPAIDRNRELPLSFTQERIWFIQQLNPGATVYNLSLVVPFEGSADRNCLSASLETLCCRHEALRVRFASVEGRPVVQLGASEPTPLAFADLRGLGAAERAGARERLLAEHRTVRFVLDRGPLLRAMVVVLDEERFEVALAVHQIACDPWSLDVLADQLREEYRRRLAGESAAPPPGEPGFLDFAAWQCEAVAANALAEPIAFWRQQLAGELPVLELPGDRTRPAQQTYSAGRESRRLSTALSAAVVAAANDRSQTPLVVLLAAFNALLSRYTGDEDIVIGCPAPGRPSPALDAVVGSFGTWAAVRTGLSGAPSFVELVARAGEAFEHAAAHADVPFAVILDAVKPRRDTSRSPIFQALLAFESDHADLDDAGPGRGVIERGGTLVDLGLYVRAEGGSFVVSAEYSRDLFDAETIARLLGHFETLLAAALDRPEAPVNALPLLTADEQGHALVHPNDTAVPIAAPLTIHQLFEAQVERTPEATAVLSDAGAVTYRELNARANQLARCLRRRGVASESLVGVCADRSLDMLVGVLAVLKAGGAYVPLDPAYPSDRLTYMLADAQVSTIVGGRSGIESIPVDGIPVTCPRSDAHAISAEDAENLSLPVDAGNLAYVIYTSGSTGRPKGVQVPHRAVVNFLHAMAPIAGLQPGDTLGAVTTLSFDIAVLELFLPLTQGATVGLIARDDTTDGGRLMEALAAADVSVLQATPATWRLLLRAGWSNRHLKMLCGGEALPRDLAADLLVAGGELWNVYGPTETTVWSTASRVTDSDRISIGQPISNTQIYVLDRHMNAVPAGVLGELYIAGDGVTRGYRHRADLTAERFIPNPFGGPGSRMYRTGDVVRRLGDGGIEFVGRADHQIKVRGFRVEPGEIETVLTAHPAIAEAVVVASELDRGDRRLVAYVTCRPGDSLTSSELRRLVRGSLPEYMVPSLFVTLDRLPHTPNGKVDRRALPPPFNGSGPERSRVAPATATERAIAEIWQRVLQVAEVSADDNFFDIGGHSLLSMRVIAEIARVLGHQVNPGSMFLENLRQIAAACDRGEMARQGRVLAAGGAAVYERYS
ncbi:MAG TPA: amino acid adenylation domain-containing protein [Vicinamibacterales bacterium]|jgi:amino acid adenylation domain-containing protein